ncbi:MAG: adaptor protein MecA [Clostridia bacterium]|nr:adaptor protein MecA [Clostridia bacterium]
MKIEKLTENKIRVIVNTSDLEVKNLDIHLLMTKALEEQNFFANMLEKAKEEVGFYTDGCKLLIEAFSSLEDILVFTITKYSPQDIKTYATPSKKKLTVKRKKLDFSSKQAIYEFRNFDEFCEFCKYISRKSNFNIKNFSKNISLYWYHNTYYLLVKNINTSYELLKTFYSVIAEFATPVHFSNSFENKLIEHGKIVIKKSAITTGIQYFS